MEMLGRYPYGDCGVSTESPWSTVAFSLSSCWRSTARSRRVHGVLGAVTAHKRRPHCAGGVPETFGMRLRGVKAA